MPAPAPAIAGLPGLRRVHVHTGAARADLR